MQVYFKDGPQDSEGDRLNTNIILFIIGLAICLIAAGLLFLGMIESGVAAVIGIIGIGLLGSSAIIRKQW